MRRIDLQQKHQSEDLAARHAVIQALAQHRDGRKFLWWLLSVSKAVANQPFANNALVMSFGCGEMNVGLQILAEFMEASPELLSQLMMENANERAARDSALAGARPDDGGPDDADPAG